MVDWSTFSISTKRALQLDLQQILRFQTFLIIFPIPPSPELRPSYWRSLLLPLFQASFFLLLAVGCSQRQSQETSYYHLTTPSRLLAQGLAQGLCPCCPLPGMAPPPQLPMACSLASPTAGEAGHGRGASLWCFLNPPAHLLGPLLALSFRVCHFLIYVLLSIPVPSLAKDAPENWFHAALAESRGPAPSTGPERGSCLVNSSWMNVSLILCAMQFQLLGKIKSAHLTRSWCHCGFAPQGHKSPPLRNKSLCRSNQNLRWEGQKRKLHHQLPAAP